MILPLARGEFAPLAPSDRSATWAVTGRLGGVSRGPFIGANIADHVGDDIDAVTLNRSSLAELVGLTAVNLSFMTPVHGASVRWVTSAGDSGECDSLITDLPGVGLVAMGADCAPIGIYGSRTEQAPLIAAVHCGWQGLCLDVVGATLDEMRSAGVNDFHAVIGPTICGKCFKVEQLRLDRVAANCSDSVAQAALSTAGGIDIQAALIAQFQEHGVTCDLVSECTYENASELFSYRRDGVTGRQALVLTLKELERG
jgi:YfiH family protein